MSVHQLPGVTLVVAIAVTVYSSPQLSLSFKLTNSVDSTSSFSSFSASRHSPFLHCLSSSLSPFSILAIVRNLSNALQLHCRCAFSLRLFSPFSVYNQCCSWKFIHIFNVQLSHSSLRSQSQCQHAVDKDWQGFGLLFFLEYGLFVELFECICMGILCFFFYGDLEMAQTMR